jgi:hypothetical protein
MQIFVLEHKHLQLARITQVRAAGCTGYHQSQRFGQNFRFNVTRGIDLTQASGNIP